MRQRQAVCEEFYTIGQLARELGVTTRTIRFYEDEGLIAPARRGGQRIYGTRERTRLKLVLRGRRLGFPLSEIAEIINLYDASPGESGQLETLIARIEERRAELLAKRQDIETSLADLEAVEVRCRDRLAEIASGSRKRSTS
jgi:DNA-binding transcriptional MerR regulator